MANILGNVFKGKDSMNGGLATQGAGHSNVQPNVRPTGNVVNLQTSGRSGSSSTHTASNSAAAQLARERAEAAKAQIEMRKAAEARRKEEQKGDSDKNGITPVGLKPPIKRPKSASVNHAQYIAEVKESGTAEGRPVVERERERVTPQPARSAAQSALALAQSVALRAQNEERRASQKAKAATAKVVECRSAVTAAEEALLTARKAEEATITKDPRHPADP